MTIRGIRQGRAACLASVLTAALLTSGAPGVWAASPAASARPATALTVVSEPSGAAVYVDGAHRGETPLAIEDIAAGDHKVRLMKRGFLENSRLVSVPAGGRSVQVRLTPTEPSPLMQVDPEPVPEKSGGGSKKLLLIGLGAVAVGGTAALVLGGGDKAPTVSSVTASPTTALQGGAVSFSAQATGEKALTYTWNFGDGGTASGASASHAFSTAGSFNVTVDVKSGSKTTTGAVGVTIRSMAGRWSGRFASYTFTMSLSQSGSAVSGTYVDVDGPGTVSGSVSSATGVRLTVSQPGYQPLTFAGTASGDLNTVTGNVSDNSGGTSFTMTRQ